MQIRSTPRHIPFTYMRASQYMALSLYILLLAFFIALTTLFDINSDRKNDVLSSVHESFRRVDNPFGLVQRGPDETRQTQAGGELPAEQVKDLLGSTLGDLRIDEQKLADGRLQMTATMPRAMFENYNAAFSRKLSEIITNEQLSTAFDVEIFMPFQAGQEAFIKQTLDVFTAQNFPSERLSFAMTPALDEAALELRFIFAAAYNPAALPEGRQ